MSIQPTQRISIFRNVCGRASYRSCPDLWDARSHLMRKFVVSNMWQHFS